jgi:hypothetical protein
LVLTANNLRLDSDFCPNLHPHLTGPSPDLDPTFPD